MRKKEGRGPTFIAAAVLIIILGAALYLAFGPTESRKTQDAAITGFSFSPISGSKPFQANIEIANQGDDPIEILVSFDISPPDLDGTGSVGTIQGNVLPVGGARNVSVPFKPASNVDYTVRVAILPRNVTDIDLTDNAIEVSFPVYHWRVSLESSLLRQNGTDVVLRIPENIGVSWGTWQSNLLEEWGFPQIRAPIYTTSMLENPNATTVNIHPTRTGRNFTLGDLFDIWGQTLTDTCISIPGQIDRCNGPGETVIYDVNGDGLYDTGDRAISGEAPSVATSLKRDSRISFADADGSGIWNSNETVVLDINGNGSFDIVDPVIFGPPPSQGSSLSDDPNITYVDSNQNNLRDPGGFLIMEVDGQVTQEIRNHVLRDGEKIWIPFVET